MTGVSYNGTLPNQVATTGVEGLKTIIPVSAISSWYDYYRANGLVVAPHSAEQRRRRSTSSRARTPTCSATSSAGRGCSRAASAASCTTTCSPTQDRVTGDYSRVLGRARLPPPRRPDPRERVRRPRPQRLQRHDEGVRRVVVPAGARGRGAQDLAPQRRPRRPAHADGTAVAARVQADREPLVRPRAVRRPQRDRPRAARDRAARGRQLRAGGRLAGAGHAPRSSWSWARARRPRPARSRPAARARPTSRSSTTGATSTPTTC